MTKRRPSIRKTLATLNSSLPPDEQFVFIKTRRRHAINIQGMVIFCRQYQNEWRPVRIFSRRGSRSPAINLYDPNTQTTNVATSVSFLILQTFVGPRPTPGSRPTPKDGDYTNLHADNWEWKERKPGIGPEELLRIKMRCDSGKHGIRSQVARELGISKQHLTNMLNGNGGCGKYLKQAMSLSVRT